MVREDSDALEYIARVVRECCDGIYRARRDVCGVKHDCAVIEVVVEILPGQVGVGKVFRRVIAGLVEVRAKSDPQVRKL